MPKETKKFINPLLRPSQNADIRPGQQPQPDLVDVPVEAPAREASPKHPETPFEPASKVEPAQTEIAQLSDKEARSVEKSNEKTLSAEEVPTNSARRSSATGVLTSRAESQGRETSRSRRSSADAEATPYTRNNSSADPVNLSSEESVLEGSYVNYDPTSSSEDSRAAARRRRSLQPFETTHERITLWMDKQLKQRFEALAYQRELPKTALINEAVSALLEKYEAR